MLGRLFTSRVRVRLLALFLTHPATAYYIREITRLTGETYNNVRQELQNLARIGIVLSERRANATFYQANMEHLLFPELKRIILKTVAFSEILGRELPNMGDVRVAFIYGSTARDTEFPSSDIDLMIIGDVKIDVLNHTIDGIEEEMNRSVNYTLFDTDEWQRRVKDRDSFVSDVLANEKVFIVGNENALSKLGASRTD